MARPSAESSEPANAGAPESALELIGFVPQDGPSDPVAARAALDAGAASDGEGEDGGGGSGPRIERASKGRRGALPGRRKGGHKATKTELEREVKELRAQLESAQPGQVELVQSQAAQLAPALGATLATVFSMMARRRGEHWKLAADEKAILAEHWAVCLAPHMAQAGPYVPWAAAVMVTWGVVEGRVERDAAVARALAA